MQPACLEEEKEGIIQHAPQEQLVQPSAWGRRSNHNLKLLEDGLTITYQPAPFPLIAVPTTTPPVSSLRTTVLSGGGAVVWLSVANVGVARWCKRTDRSASCRGCATSRSS
jgi:hypothetical protein